MGARIATFLLALAIAAFGFGGTAFAGNAGDDVVFVRQEDADGVVALGDDDDDGGDDTGDDTGGITSGVDSNDGTNSWLSAVSRDDDRSRGDLTRDRTKDGPGTSTRDRTANSTNDASRNDTR
jgi:hypothetical protein